MGRQALRERTAEQTDRRAAAVVDELVATESAEVLERIAVRLEQARVTNPLIRTMQLWNLSHADVAKMFDISRQSIAKWMNVGVPADRISAVADLAAATDILARHIKHERIPAVVRRRAPALDDRSLLELATGSETRAVLAACRSMFAFGNVDG